MYGVDGRCSNYILVIKNYIAYKGVPYIRDLTVYLTMCYKGVNVWLKAVDAAKIISKTTNCRASGNIL